MKENRLKEQIEKALLTKQSSVGLDIIYRT